jgi:hypothetical protein
MPDHCIVKTTLLSICIILSATSFGQQLDNYQSKSVIREHSVSMRTMRFDGGTRSSVICHYDPDGRLVTWTLTDNETGKKPQAIIHYNYDAQGNPVSATEIADEDSVSIAFEYADGKLARRISRFSNGSLKEQIEYSYSPYREVQSFYWGDNEVYRKQTSVHDEKGNIIKFSGFDLSDSTSSGKWNYIYENELDAGGKLIRRTNKSGDKVLSVKEYFYNKKGLLVSISTRHSIVGGFKSEEKFYYAFYKRD